MGETYAKNKKAYFDYFLEEKFEAGLVLSGSEVKGIRAKRVNLKDSFIAFKEGTKVNKSVTIYSKSKGRLVHLVEFGFVHRSGRFVSARPFLRPSYEKEAPKMEEKIKARFEKV